MLKYFKKKEEVKEFKPNTLSKVLSVLPFIPLLLLILAMISSKISESEYTFTDEIVEVEQQITAADLAGAVQFLVGIDYGGVMYTSIEGVDDTVIFSMACLLYTSPSPRDS